MSLFAYTNLKSFNDKLNKKLSLQRDCLREHLSPPPIVLFRLSVIDINNHVIFYTVLFSESYVRNFYNWFTSQICLVHSKIMGTDYGSGYLTLKDINGYVRSSDSRYSYISSLYYAIGVYGNIDRGIVVGSGDAVEVFDDFNLNNLISHGSSSGQLIYEEQLPTLCVWDSESKTFTSTFERRFLNSSPAVVDVKEIGYMSIIHTDSPYSFLLLRDLLPSPVSIPINSLLRVVYEFIAPLPE